MSGFLDDLFEMHETTHKDDLEVDRQKIVRAPFTMPGSKSASVKHILPHLPMRKKWVEYFCGSAVLTINRPKATLEVINDRNSGIVAFYRCLRDKNKLEELIQWIELNIMSREDFYWCKETWCNETDDVIRAGKWYYTVRQSVIGKGHCFGRGTNIALKNRSLNRLDLFPLIHDRLQNVLIENLDWEVCFNDFDCPDTVHYFDPPYIGTDGGVYKDKWTRGDLRRLLSRIKHSKGFCALSGYEDEEIDKCDFWTDRYTWNIPIHAEVSSFTDENHKQNHMYAKTKRDEAKEVLWLHNP